MAHVRMPSRPELLPDVIVAERCRLLRKLGEGGMGEVWLAEHTTLKTRVAVKFLNDSAVEHGISDEALERFMFEAQVSAMLAHETPHVVRVHDAGRDERGPYMVMEYVEGRSLEEAIEQDGPLAPSALAEIVDQVAAALAIAHRRSIVHRDLKPGNVMLSTDPSGRTQAKLADFGIAKATGACASLDRPQETLEGLLVGSPDYMSPEQLHAVRDLDARVDVWALGVLAYQALTGERPFDAPTIGGVVIAVTTGAFVPPSMVRRGVPRELDAWFTHALAKRREERFSSATEAARAFRVALEAAHPTPPPVAAAAPPRRRVALGVLLVAAAVVLAGLVWIGARSTVPGPAAGVAPTQEPAAATAVSTAQGVPVRMDELPAAPASLPAASASNEVARPSQPAVRGASTPRPRPAAAPNAPKDPSATF